MIFPTCGRARSVSRLGGVITCFMGIAIMPWKLLDNYKTFIFGWLGGYAAFLGPVAGIMICDYWVIRKRSLLVDDLYLRGGAYEYSGGFNWKAVAALALGAAVALSGLVIPAVRFGYDYSWFVGFAVSFATYYGLMAMIFLKAKTSWQYSVHSSQGIEVFET